MLIALFQKIGYYVKPISVLLDVMKTSKSLDNDENIPLMKETVDDTMR